MWTNTIYNDVVQILSKKKLLNFSSWQKKWMLLKTETLFHFKNLYQNMDSAHDTGQRMFTMGLTHNISFAHCTGSCAENYMHALWSCMTFQRICENLSTWFSCCITTSRPAVHFRRCKWIRYESKHISYHLMRHWEIHPHEMEIKNDLCVTQFTIRSY